MMVTDQPRFLEGYPCFLARIEGRVSLHSVFVCVCVCVLYRQIDRQMHRQLG